MGKKDTKLENTTIKFFGKTAFKTDRYVHGDTNLLEVFFPLHRF